MTARWFTADAPEVIVIVVMLRRGATRGVMMHGKLGYCVYAQPSGMWDS